MARFVIGYSARAENFKWTLPAAVLLAAGPAIRALLYPNREPFDVWLAVATAIVVPAAVIVRIRVLDPRRRKAEALSRQLLASAREDTT